jgi:hypothetical protein
VSIGGYDLPGAWVLSGRSVLLRASGAQVPMSELIACQSGSFAGDVRCLTAKGDLHFDVTFHPANRYWPFQLIETSLFLLLALALAGLCFWRLPRGVG